jgi:hypothetical protein
LKLSVLTYNIRKGKGASGRDYALPGIAAELASRGLDLLLVQEVFHPHAAAGQSSELARFNDYFIKAKADEQYLLKNIEDLRTHCSKVRAQASQMSGGTGVPAFLKLFGYLGLRSADREKELAEKLDKLAYEDFAVANSAQKMLECLTAALKDVQDALGTGGAMYLQNVPAAAALLGTLGPPFSDMEELASDGVRELRSVIEDLV